MMPERYIVEEAVTVALHDIQHGVKAQINLELVWYHIAIPENWSQPEAEGKENLDNMGDVFDKDTQGREQPAKAQKQEDQADHVIEGLKPENGRLHPADPDNCHDDEQKNDVEE